MTPGSAKINNDTKIKTTHYDNGKVESKTPYVNGKKHGLVTEWYESGAKNYEITWGDGKAHGVNTAWRENGTRMWEVTYAYGKKHGVQTWWDKNGNKEMEMHHHHKEEYSRMHWDEEGNVTATALVTPNNNKGEGNPRTRFPSLPLSPKAPITKLKNHIIDWIS